MFPVQSHYVKILPRLMTCLKHNHEHQHQHNDENTWSLDDMTKSAANDKCNHILTETVCLMKFLWNVGLGLPQRCSGQHTLPAVRLCHLQQSRTVCLNMKLKSNGIQHETQRLEEYIETSLESVFVTVRLQLNGGYKFIN